MSGMLIHYGVMYLSIVIFAIALPGSCISSQRCEKQLRENNIVPDIVHSCKGKLQVNFSGHNNLNCGDGLSDLIVLEKKNNRGPKVKFDARKVCTKYASVIMTDLDSLVLFAPFLHWDVHNIPVDVLASGYQSGDKGYAEFPWSLPGTVTGSCISSQRCEKQLKENHIVPDIVQSCTGKLQVQFGETSLQCGDDLPMSNIFNTPVVKFDARKKCKKYATVIMTDLDSLTFLSPFLHWDIQNIPVEVLAEGYTEGSEGNVKFSWGPFFPATPTGTHHFTFFTFCQDRKVPVRPPKCILTNFLGRLFFNVTAFQKSYGFGNPVACNFFKLTL